MGWIENRMIGPTPGHVIMDSRLDLEGRSSPACQANRGVGFHIQTFSAVLYCSTLFRWQIAGAQFKYLCGLIY